MRTINLVELNEVSAGFGAADASFVLEKTVSYGATGVLANIIVGGSYALAAVGYGFAVGAVVGAAYGAVTVVAHTLHLY